MKVKMDSKGGILSYQDVPIMKKKSMAEGMVDEKEIRHVINTVMG
jgi:hypothetical protein